MEGGHVVQIGTPQDIIASPADDYVRAFFEGVDTSQYLTAGDVMQTSGVRLVRNLAPSSVEAWLNGSAEYAFVVDAGRRIRGLRHARCDRQCVTVAAHVARVRMLDRAARGRR
jgi:glycine betaine/proline transport system ATP-binding protein